MRLPFGKVKDGENGELDQPTLVAPAPAYADAAHAHSSRSLPTDLKPPVSPLTEDKRSNSLFSRKQTHPPPSSLCPPPEPDDGSFKVVSFRHIGLPTHPAHAPNGSFVALAPRPRQSRTFSSDSSQLISVAAFRDQSRRNSMAGSLGSSFRAPSPGPHGPLPRSASVPGIRPLQMDSAASGALSDTEDDDYGDEDDDKNNNAQSAHRTLKSVSSLPWATPAEEKGANQSEVALAQPESDISTVAARSLPVRKRSSLLSYSLSTEEGSLAGHLESPWESVSAAAQKPSTNIGTFVSLSPPSATPTVAHTSSDAGIAPLSPVITSTPSPQPPQLSPASVEDTTDQDAFDMSWTLLNRLNESEALAPKTESSAKQSPEDLPAVRPRILQAGDPANRSSMAVLSTQPKAATHRRSASEQRSVTQDDDDLAGVLGGALSLISRDANDPIVADSSSSSFKPVHITRREPTPGFAVTSRPKQILANDAPKVAPSLDTWSVSSGSSEASSSTESLAPPPSKPAATSSRASSPFKAGRPTNNGSKQSLAGRQARPPPQSAPAARPRSSSQMPPPQWPRPWATPDSSTGDSSSPPTPKDGSDIDISSGPRRPFANETKPRSASLGVADERAKEQAKIKTQMERHRKEARAAIELGHAVNPNSVSDPSVNKRQHQRRNSNMSAFTGWGGPMSAPMAPSPVMMPGGQMVASPYMPLSPNPQFMAAAAAAAHQQQAMMYATQAYQLAAMQQQQQAWAASSPVAWGTPQATGYFPPQPVATPRGSGRPRTVSTPMKPKMTGQQARAASQPPKMGHGASAGPNRKRVVQPSTLR